MSLDTCDPDLKPILSRVFSLYLASIVEKNLAWFVISGLVPRYNIQFQIFFQYH